MKKVLFVGMAALFSSVTMAQTVICSATGTPIVTIPGSSDGSTFVRTTFNPTCSPSTHMIFQQDSAALWAAAASSKGGNTFGGSTNGGSVKALGPCNTGKTCGTTAPTDAAARLAAAKIIGDTN
jgi:hypothetical protein